MKAVLYVLLVLGIGYPLVLLALYFWQPRLVFLPDFGGRELAATPRSIGLPFEEVWIEASDGVTIHGWFVQSPGPGRTLLFFHGNAGNISHRLESLRIFSELGLDVLMVDYRGYGQSQGRPSEEGTRRDALAAWEYLVRERAVPASDIVLFGRSLGGSVAVQLAREREAGGLIVESTFTSVPDLGAEIYPWLPVRLLSSMDFDSESAIGEVEMPVLVVHSREDDIVPYAHGLRLYEAAREPREWLEISGPHNGGYLRDRAAYVDGLRRFIESLPRAARD